MQQEISNNWSAISLTYVEYPKGDFIGKCLAWISLSPFILIVALCTLILFRRDLHTISYAFGLLLNEFINLILKHVIKEPRPTQHRSIRTEYGMPSSHSQFIWFFTAYMLCFLLLRVHSSGNLIQRLWKFLIFWGFFSLAILVPISRVYLEYHTCSQACYGCILGAFLGLLWFATVHLVFTPFFPIITSWPICELLMLRDSTLIPNVLWFEYTSHRSEVRSRLRKVSSRKSQ